jgi:hypothetical protein
VTVLVLLVPAGWLAVLFWRVPVHDPLTVSSLLLDRLMQVATAVALPAVVVGVALGPREVARAAALVGGLVSVLLGGCVAAVALRPPVDVAPTLLALLTLACGLGQLAWMLQGSLLSRRWRVSLLALLALLPLLQFWHATSFVPARMTTSVTMTARITMQHAAGDELRGVVEVELRNDGDIGARLLGSQLAICTRPDVDALAPALPTDPACTSGPLFTDLTEIHARTSRIYHGAIEVPAGAPLVQLVSEASYARDDRLRVGGARAVTEEELRACPELLSVHPIIDDSRLRGVVEKDRLLVYTGQQWLLTTTGESMCEPSRYPLFEYVGVANVHLNQQDWFPVPPP